MRTVIRAAVCLLLFTSPVTAFSENTNFTTSHFSGSGNCSMCHDGLTDTSGDNVSIVRDWGTSMMANSTKDPLWKAKVATELERNAHLSDVINDKCTKCHAPMANYEITRVQGGNVTLFGPNGILEPGHALHDAGMNGVSCTVCHQITDDASLGQLDGFSGNYHINDTKTIYGQYSDIFGNPMINNTGYTPTYSAHVSDSALCASCHNLKTPFVDSNGNLASSTPESEFPEQMPYTEWQFSIFDDAGSNPQSCQDCHMPHTTSKVSNRPNWLGAKNGFAKHHLVGANTTMLTMLRDNAAQLDVTSTNMDLGIDRARAMLQSAATVEIVSASVSNGELQARVRVQNSSGHKTPTGYPSRRMWLHFTVTDASSNVVFESGRINADGSIVGADSDSGAEPAQYEPHYEEITAADQVQIYEPIMGDTDGNVTYTLLRGAQYLKDNRLTPQGFDKYAVPSDVAVYGAAATDPDFNTGSDELVYRVQNTPAGDLTISVSLNYQTIAHGYLLDMYKDLHLEQVQTFKTMYDAQSLKYEQITSAQTTVVSDGGGTTPPPEPTATLTATPNPINAGEFVSLDWTSTDATGCTVTGGGLNNVSGTSGTVSDDPGVTTTYTLDCSGDGGSASDSVIVTVDAAPAPVPTASLAAAPNPVTAGEFVDLTWTSTDATGCTVTGGGLNSVSGTSGTVSDDPGVTTTYTLDCSGDGGSASDSVIVTVNQPPTTPAPVVSLTASPSRVSRGSSITLNWSSTDANSCTASGNWSGAKAATGSESIAISSAVTFTLTCSGDGGSASASVSYGTRGRRWLELR